jgi:uncharacterized protein YndB with AHSA1/START domain
MDGIFKALADTSRRRLLDALNIRNGQSQRELGSGLNMTRQAVAKHLAVLEAANLVTTVRRGREKLHYLNAVPINDIAERWIDRYDRQRVRALVDLKRDLEERSMSQTEFVYVTYIQTTPEKLWRALIEPAFIARYMENTGPKSSWEVGAPVLWSMSPDQDPADWGQVVLESDPPRRLSYTWHNYQPEMMEMFGWSEEQFTELVKEKISKVTFEIEAVGSAVKLTVTHDDFEPYSKMLKGVSQGWPSILSNLKTLLETDTTLKLSAE